MATKLKIKKGDKVIAIAGKDKGKTGEVLKVMPKENRVIVAGIQMIKRHTKPSQTNPQGGIIQREAAMHISNVAHLDPKDNKAVRIGYKTEKDGKTRVARRSGQQIA